MVGRNKGRNMTNDNGDMRDRPGTLHDDALSNRTEIGGVPFMDLAAMNEDARIMAAGRAAQTQGKKVGVLVDSDAVDGCKGKADRYVRKLRERYPDLIVRIAGNLTPLTTVIEVSPKISRKDFLRG